MTPGTRIGHYTIVGSLGAGGMGEVYRARDTKLDRDVALKILPADMASYPDRLERFRREARALAALDHPGIVSVYSVEEADGVHFLTMQLVEGESLDRVIPAGGLPLDRLLEIATPLADALAAAHEKGIVHRDLKPANVMVTSDGRVKVLDFGLAKTTRAEHAAGLDDERPTQLQTREGIVMGTMPYMSPEQLQAREVDHRTDIFSLGTILYEMATGRRPFRGHSSAELVSSILRDPPPPLIDLRTDLPAGLRQLIEQCLEKDPADRIRVARDVIAELRALRAGSAAFAASVAAPASSVSAAPSAGRARRWRVVAAIAVVAVVVGAVLAWVSRRERIAASAIDSIVVLPFENPTGDPETDYISDGITASISSSLTGLADLKVIPTSVAFHYKGTGMTTQAIGDELRVAAVLTGRVSQRGDELSVSVELDDVREQKQLWGAQYNRKLVDLLAVQREIAGEVSQRLRSEVSGEVQRQLTRGSTENPVAFQLYLKGIYQASKYSQDGFRKSIDYFNQALAEDPNYALAHGGLAFSYINSEDWFWRPHDAAPKAKAAAKKALAIDETSSVAHLALALVSQWYDWDWAISEREFLRAIELSPNDPLPRGHYTWLLLNLGRYDEAVAEAKRAQQLDPASPVTNFMTGSVLVFAHRFDEAIQQLLGALKLEPNYWYAHNFLGRAYEQVGKMPEAIAAYRKALELENDNAENWSHLGHAYARIGQRNEALTIIEQLKATSAESYVAPYNVALIYAGLGDKEQAFAWLEQAYAERSSMLALYMSNDARWDVLRGDPRFDDLARRIGLPASGGPGRSAQARPARP